MSLEGLAQEQIKAYEEQLLRALPDGGVIGNTSLQEKLAWNDDALYWSIRNRLIDSGRLEKGRGRGGSVRRVIDVLVPQPVVSTDAAAVTEAQLYEPILGTIKSDWVQDYRSDAFIVETTAHQGRKETGGKWSRPDITLATYSTYPYVPGKHFDVTTFEIKKHDALDVTAVYEALAHRRAAHYSYVLVVIPDNMRSAFESILEDLTYEASQHGVGLVVLADPKNYKTWEVFEEAERNDPDPADLNNFLATQVSQGFKEQIARWFR